MRLFVRTLFLLFTLLFVPTTALFILQPRIPLHGLTSSASSLVSHFTGKSTTIEGRYFITPGRWTVLEVEDSEISIQDGTNISLVKTEAARTSVHLFSLFQRRLVLDGFSLRGLDSDIRRRTASQGNDAADLSRDLSNVFAFEMTGAIDVSNLRVRYTKEGSGSQLPLQIDRAKGFISETFQGQLDIEGEVAGDPIVINLTSDTGGSKERERRIVSFALNLAYKSIQGNIKGELHHLADAPVLICDGSLSGEHIKDGLSLLGINSYNGSPFTIKGQLWLTKQNSKVLLTELSPGTTGMISSLSVSNYQQQTPEYHLSLQAESVDLELLSGWFDAAGPEPKENGQAAAYDDSSIFELLPDHLDLYMNLANLKFGDQTVKDIKLDSTISSPGISRIPFTAQFEHADLTGHFTIDSQKPEPALTAHLKSERWDIGKALSNFGLAKEIGFVLEEVVIDVKMQGQSVAELSAGLSFDAAAGKGLLTAKDPNTGSQLNVVLDKTGISGGAGRTLQLDAQGEVNEFPITLATTIDPEPHEPGNRLSSARIDQLVMIGDTRWHTAGSIPLPFSLDNFSVKSSLQGQDLNELDIFLDLELPHTGSYSASTTVSAVSGGYELTGLTIKSGESSVSGDVSFNGKAAPPWLSVDLTSDRIQLDDFRTLAFDNEADDGADRDKEHEPSNRLTDQDIVESYNAAISLEIKEVLSGDDHLGGGLLKFTQKDGNLYLDPLRIALPEGSVELTLIRKPVGGSFNYLLNSRIDDLDYGIVARHLNPEAESTGNVNLRSSLYSDSPDFDTMLANATGYIDFSLEPEKLRAGAIDLWAVNLLSFLTPLLIPKNESRINCVAGQFDIVHGKLTERDLLIDTSKIQVSGTVNIDFEKESIDATLKPRPKRAQFYSLATPININGQLSDFNTGVGASGIIGTTIRLATSYFVVPFQWLTQERVPADDRQKCLQIVQRRGDLIQNRLWELD